MKKLLQRSLLLFLSFVLLTFFSCREKSKAPANEAIDAINLKKGELVLCSPPDKQFPDLGFETSCSEKAKTAFNLGISLLHSFEYDEAEKAFAKIIYDEPECAMAYWGVAMCNYHQLWPAPPSPTELTKGVKAISIAQSISNKSQRESDYIDAISVFYKDWEKVDHRTRSLNFEKAMEKLYKAYPDDKEAAIFYALALDGAADPADKTFANQKKAGAILNAIYPNEPNHPGIVHYIIHSYDSPELASLGLEAARKYASVAPYSAHALHMPSHIFTRLGLWDEDINSNLNSISSAKCYAESAGINGHWDEELHGMDYVVYAYLQKGENKLAKDQCNYLDTMKIVYPVNFKVAYAFAAIPSRYVLENKMWQEAAALNAHKIIPWQKFPWQNAIIHFTRSLGSVHIGNIDSARAELNKLKTIHDTLTAQKDTYRANQVKIQINSAEAWILFKEGKKDEALQMMKLAADMEDKTEKAPVTPGEVLPASELLADMLLEMNKPDKALLAYEEDLKKHPNRFNALYYAGSAAEKSGNAEKANKYYLQLTSIAGTNQPDRPELEAAKSYIKNQRH